MPKRGTSTRRIPASRRVVKPVKPPEQEFRPGLAPTFGLNTNTDQLEFSPGRAPAFGLNTQGARRGDKAPPAVRTATQSTKPPKRKPKKGPWELGKKGKWELGAKGKWKKGGGKGGKKKKAEPEEEEGLGLAETGTTSFARSYGKTNYRVSAFKGGPGKAEERKKKKKEEEAFGGKGGGGKRKPKSKKKPGKGKGKK